MRFLRALLALVAVLVTLAWCGASIGCMMTGCENSNRFLDAPIGRKGDEDYSMGWLWMLNSVLLVASWWGVGRIDEKVEPSNRWFGDGRHDTKS